MFLSEKERGTVHQSCFTRIWTQYLAICRNKSITKTQNEFSCWWSSILVSELSRRLPIELTAGGETFLEAKKSCGSREGHFLITDARSHLLDLGSRNKGRSNQWSQVISHIWSTTGRQVIQRFASFQFSERNRISISRCRERVMPSCQCRRKSIVWDSI